MSATPILTCDELIVGYRRRGRTKPVLAPIAATVARGTFTALLGPNGTGKSTLLRTIAALQRPLSGAISIAGSRIDSYRAAELARLVGVVLSEPIAVGALTGRQLVSLGRYAHTGWDGRLDAADLEAVERALDAAGAMHLAERDCREISDGERQKLNLARVLAQEPALIILDEPTVFLDVTAREELMQLLHRLTREQDIAVIASSHDLDLALRHADGVWLIDRAGAMAKGVPEDLMLAGTIGRVFDNPLSTAAGVPDMQPTAVVRGPRAFVPLGEAVLLRTGYRIVHAGSAASITIEIGEDGERWHAHLADGDIAGTSYAALATLARQTAHSVSAIAPAANLSSSPSRSRGQS